MYFVRVVYHHKQTSDEIYCVFYQNILIAYFYTFIIYVFEDL